MKKPFIRLSDCFLLIGLLWSTSLVGLEKPNFVVIFIDDMGYGDIEPFGSKINKTPHLTRMAAEGRTFSSSYVDLQV